MFPDASVPSPVDYDSPTRLSALLDELGCAMRKKYGQNFLVSPQARTRIMDLADIHPGARTWEIGPGIGAMTREALLRGAALSTFEIDRGFAAFIRETYGAAPGFELYEGDFLRTWRSAVAASGRPERVFGNLPYNVAGAMVAALIEGGAGPSRMTFTVQREAARRMTADPGCKDYSAFTVLCRSAYAVKRAFDLPPGAFWPPPRVVSSVVVMETRKDPIPCAGQPSFTSLTRAAFASRRKTLRNNLAAAGWTDEQVAAAAEAAGTRSDARAETLSPEAFAAMHAVLSVLPRRA